MNRFAQHLLLIIAVAAMCGCQSGSKTGQKPIDDKYLAVIPSTAKQVAEGHGNFKHKAEASGLLYLYDAQLNRVVDAQRISKGQMYSVSSDRSTVWIDDRPTRLNGLNGQHQLRIYIDPS